jgi:hypothetical protein
MVVAPFLVSLVFFSGATALALYLGTYTYSIDDGQGPYRDTGFLASPFDWSDRTWINTSLAAANAFFTLLFCLAHTHRLSILRRLMFIFGVAQILQLTQMSSTRFPDPNVRLRDRRWCYSMHVVQYVLSALFVQFYSPRNGLRAMCWMFSLSGLALLIPTHQYYTVDVISAVFACTAVFFPYHWQVRTTASIMKRPGIRWFEQDAVPHISQHISISTERALPFHSYSHRHVPAGGYGGDSPASVSPSSGFFNPTHQHAFRNEDSGLDNQSFLHTSSDDPRCDYNLEHFRSPSFAINSMSSMMQQLSRLAGEESESMRLYWPPAVAVVTAVIAGAVAMLNLVSISAADRQRPLHIPLPRDILFENLPSTPAHTADVLLYTQVVSVFLFTLSSKYRFTILRRTGVMYAFLMGLRCFTVPATFPPDPSPLCVERTHPEGTTCGDLIFSGHTVAFTLSALVVRRYTKPAWIEAAVWAFTACGLAAVITSRLHYSRDVVTALYIVFTVYYVMHVALFERVDRILKLRWLRYFELDFYVLRAEDERAADEKRLPWHDWIGRFWRYCARSSSLDPRVRSDSGEEQS